MYVDFVVILLLLGGFLFLGWVVSVSSSMGYRAGLTGRRIVSSMIDAWLRGCTHMAVLAVVGGVAATIWTEVEGYGGNGGAGIDLVVVLFLCVVLAPVLVPFTALPCFIAYNFGAQRRAQAALAELGAPGAGSEVH